MAHPLAQLPFILVAIVTTIGCSGSGMKSVKSEPNVVISNDGKWGGDPYNFNSAILDGDE